MLRVFLLSLPLACPAAVWRVAPEGPPLAHVLQQATDGDEIRFASGDHIAPAAVIGKRLRLVGEGPGRPRLLAAGRSAGGKAIWVTRADELVIENLEFRGARVRDRNGAGIRHERGRLHIRRCAFVDNEMGLMTGNDGQAVLVVEDSEFAQAVDHAESRSHLLYAGTIARLELRGSRLSQGRNGHLLKSRARQSEVLGNEFVDPGEASYELDFPNGGEVRVQGNRIEQSWRTGNRVMLAYGAEGPRWAVNRLELRDNVFNNHALGPATYVKTWPLPGLELSERGNRYEGRGGSPP